MSHSGERLNDARLGLLVSVPRDGERQGRRGEREKEKRAVRAARRLCHAGEREMHALEPSASAPLLPAAPGWERDRSKH